MLLHLLNHLRSSANSSPSYFHSEYLRVVRSFRSFSLTSFLTFLFNLTRQIGRLDLLAGPLRNYKSLHIKRPVRDSKMNRGGAKNFWKIIQIAVEFNALEAPGVSSQATNVISDIVGKIFPITYTRVLPGYDEK